MLLLSSLFVGVSRGFGSTAGEYGDSSMGMDFGMLGVSGGKLRLPGGVEKKGREWRRMAATL